MKKAILSLAILASVSMGISARNAEKGNKSREGRSPFKELNLTADQEQKMKNLRETYDVKRKELSDAYRKDMDKILTPEQKAKMETIKKERAERKQANRKGGKKGKRAGNDTRTSKTNNTQSTQG